MARSAKDIGKYAENKAARDLGGKRTKIRGESAPDVIDSRGKRVEAKFRTHVPKWLEEIFFDVTRAEVDYGVLYLRGQRDALIFHRLSEWQEKGLLIGVPDPEDIVWGEEDKHEE